MYRQEGEQKRCPGDTAHRLYNICGKNIAIDSGMGVSEENYFPAMTGESKSLDAILVTHRHLDHSGHIPALAKDNPNALIGMTMPTSRGMLINIKDCLKIDRQKQMDIRRLGGQETPFIYDIEDAINLGKRMKIFPKPGWYPLWPGWLFGIYPSGHTRGAMMIFIIPPKGLAYLFTGDVSSHNQPLVKGVMLPPEEFLEPLRGKNIVVITETTYGDRELKKPMPKIQKEFQRWVEDRIKIGRLVFLPSFADRGPGLLKLITDLGIPCHVDGLSRDFCEMDDSCSWCDQDIELHLNDLIAKKLAIIYPRINRRISPKNWEKEKAHRIDSDSGSCCNLEKPSPIISSSAMLDKGASVKHAERILPNPKAAVVSTGHIFPNSVMEQVQKSAKDSNVLMNIEGTEKSIRVNCEVNHFSLSGHDSADKLVERIARINEFCKVEAVIGHHGDDQNYSGFEKRVKALNLNIPLFRGEHLKDILL